MLPHDRRGNAPARRSRRANEGELSMRYRVLAKDVAAGGILAVDGQSATVTVEKKQQDANGGSTSTMTQNFRIDGDRCLVSR